MRKKLTKSTTNKVFTGTLGGIAEYLGIDPTIVRVIYVILSMFTLGSPIVLYIILSLVIPSPNKFQSKPYKAYESTNRPIKTVNPTDKDDQWSDF